MSPPGLLAGGARGGARGAHRGGTPEALRARGAPARPDLRPSIRARGAGAALLCPRAPGCAPAPPPIGQRGVSGGGGDALRLRQLRGGSPAPRAPTRDGNCDGRASKPGSPERTRLLGFCLSLVLTTRAAGRPGELGLCRAPRRDPVCAPGPPCSATRIKPSGLRGSSQH